MSASDSVPASSVRAPGPIQPRETAIARANAMPATTATPPVQARTRPPRRSSRSNPARAGAGDADADAALPAGEAAPGLAGVGADAEPARHGIVAGGAGAIVTGGAGVIV